MNAECNFHLKGTFEIESSPMLATFQVGITPTTFTLYICIYCKNPDFIYSFITFYIFSRACFQSIYATNVETAGKGQYVQMNMYHIKWCLEKQSIEMTFSNMSASLDVC